MSVSLASREHEERRPGCSPDGAESVVAHQLSTSITQKALTPLFSVPATHPGIPDPTVPGDVLFAAKWAIFERVASQLMDEADIARWTRVSRIYGEWAVREAELNNPDEARRCHDIHISTAQRAELIRRYPGEMTDSLAVLADIFCEKHEAL